MLELNKIYCGDCLDLMREMDDKSVDLVLTDPPYGVGIQYKSYDDSESNWYDLMQKIIPEMTRIGKMVIIPSCQIKRLPWFYKNYPPDWLICWYKGSTGAASFIGFNDWEPHLVYGKIRTQMHDFFKATPEPQNNGHPCQKPLAWSKWLVEKATIPGELVLDPFLGSGTTAVACKKLGRNFIGIEKEPAYVEIALKRLEKVNNHKLGDFWENGWV